MEYKMLKSESRAELEELIERYLNLGWELEGEIETSNRYDMPYFRQAVTKL